MVRLNTPSSDICAMISSGMYSLSRCHACAYGTTWPSANLRISSRIESSVSSRPQAQIGQADDLALAHGNAAENLGQIFAGADAHDQILDLAEIAGVDHPRRIGRKLPDRLHVGREPGQAMGGALLAVEHPGHRAALDRDPGGDGMTAIG